MARIRHIAIFSDDPEHLAKFYVEVFGMTVKGKTEDGGSVWMTDGYMDIALLKRTSELAPEGVHHFGITACTSVSPSRSWTTSSISRATPR